MSAHQLERFLRDAHLPAAGKGLLIPGVGYMLGWGVTVPTDSVTTDNYAPGAWFFHTDGATDQTLIYINCGTRISNNFDPITSITLSDAGGLITATNVEDALQEAFQHIQSAQAFLNIPMYSWQEADGTALAAFANGDSTTPGYADASEISGIRWNNHANPDPISTSVAYPPDLDPAADVIMHFLGDDWGCGYQDRARGNPDAGERQHHWLPRRPHFDGPAQRRQARDG